MTGIRNRSLIWMIVLLLLSGCNFLRSEKTEETEIRVYPQVEAGITEIDKQGDIILNMSVQKLNEAGYETGDVITVNLNDKTFEMPIGLTADEVSSDETICLFENQKSGSDIVKLAVRDGSFCTEAGIGEVELIEEDPGYRLVLKDDAILSAPVFLNMKEKQGHSDDYPADESLYKRTYERTDYPLLNDEEYANFREVEIGNIGDDILYRSSSPLNPKYNRNKEADAACRKAGIRTIINMADFSWELKDYDGYEDSYYKDCDVSAISIDEKFNTHQFEIRLAKGYRFLIKHEGPYLIHCAAGKDRTGFSIAILECLMGAEADEVVSDYMKTFENFYGIKLGSVVYNDIAGRNIKSDLAKAFRIDSIYDDVDLSACAEKYLRRIGLKEKQIEVLKQRLQGNS